MSDAAPELDVENSKQGDGKQTTTAVKSFISGGFGGVSAVLVGAELAVIQEAIWVNVLTRHCPSSVDIL